MNSTVALYILSRPSNVVAVVVWKQRYGMNLVRQFFENWSELCKAPNDYLRDRAYAALMDPMRRNEQQRRGRRNTTGGMCSLGYGQHFQRGQRG